jgi:hypothetical protein
VTPKTLSPAEADVVKSANTEADASDASATSAINAAAAAAAAARKNTKPHLAASDAKAEHRCRIALFFQAAWLQDWSLWDNII